MQVRLCRRRWLTSKPVLRSGSRIWLHGSKRSNSVHRLDCRLRWQILVLSNKPTYKTKLHSFRLKVLPQVRQCRQRLQINKQGLRSGSRIWLRGSKRSSLVLRLGCRLRWQTLVQNSKPMCRTKLRGFRLKVLPQVRLCRQRWLTSKPVLLWVSKILPHSSVFNSLVLGRTCKLSLPTSKRIKTCCVSARHRVSLVTVSR